MNNNKVFSTVDRITVNLTSITDKVIDISRMLLNIEIYENIFEFFLTGKLVLSDTYDLIQHFPIIGNENIEIIMNLSDGSYRKLNFKLYKIYKDVADGRGDRKNKIYIIYFCSEAYIKNTITSISKKYTGKPEQIISGVLSEMGSNKNYDYEASDNNIEIYSNFWNPSRIIDFASRLCKGTYLDYIFFENLDGFTFKSISNLISQDSNVYIGYNNQSETFIDYNQIKVHKMDSYFDINSNARNGMFGNTFYKPDDKNYSYIKEESTLKENVEEIFTNGLSFPYAEELNKSDNYVNVNYYDPKVSSIRMASIKMLQNYNLVVKLSGDINKKCGDVINVNFPNKDNEKSINYSFGGKWLIKGVKHVIYQNNNYHQNISLVKNVLFDNSKLSRIKKLRNI